MILKLTNIGRLKPTEISIDGLTVICGNNNTGKSTIGKVLFCLFTSFYDIEKSIQKEKEELIFQYLFTQLPSADYRNARSFQDHTNRIMEADGGSEEEIRLAVEDVLKKYKYENYHSSPKEISDHIRQILQVDKDAVIATLLKRSVDYEFEGHLGNVNHPRRRTSVDLKIKDQHLAFHTTGVDEHLLVDHYFNLNKRIIYLEDPFVLDHINDFDYLPIFFPYSHSYNIGSKIRENRLRSGRTSVVEEVLRSQKLEMVIAKINQISEGEIVVEDGKLLYHHTGLKNNLGLGSLSTGIKTFIIIKELLLNGELEENGVMIIDEPEVHLHPEWQIKLAEIIVLLQKAFGLHIILTTHSMDFLSALIHYSKEYGIEETCNYYLTQLVPGEKSEPFPLSQIKRMNQDIQGLYASIAEPFEKLYQHMDIGDQSL